MLTCWEVKIEPNPLRLRRGRIIWWRSDIGRAWSGRRVIRQKDLISVGMGMERVITWLAPTEVSDRKLIPSRYPGKAVPASRWLKETLAKIKRQQVQIKKEVVATIPELRSLGLVR